MPNHSLLQSLFVIAFVGLLGPQCSQSKKVVEAPVPIKEEFLDTLVVTAPRIDTAQYSEESNDQPVVNNLPVYRKTPERTHDLIHTRLDLSFDWENEEVLGVAELSLTSHFYALDWVQLDAVNFEIKSVTMMGKDVEYTYDQKDLSIQLDRAYASDEVYVLRIEYVARPSIGAGGGSAAITSDQGLFFINARQEDAYKPQQIWTQGETEHNSRWFPTIDRPNERCTQEVYLTVQDRFETLSNGIKVSSTPNADGTRTDYWKMDLPHAPYLFMLAIGEFAVVEESWKGLPVKYYVEKEYEEDAKYIFNHTPEMLEFFSNLLGVDYPWPSYSQVVVRDYVSGAMENTTGVIFGDFVQKKKEELIDNTNDYIVAHELIHHWFGDLVTCESWSNLTMNEGFANYGEYLWFEYKYGRDEADYHRVNELQGYLGDVASGNIHPLIHFRYEDKEDMFDGHSYNKGGLVLHMLRRYVGDEAFYSSLQKYLNDNAFQPVEAHHLRLAFEEVTGQDLNWFFNQWYFAPGHPVIDATYTWQDGNLNIDLEQTQDPEFNLAIYEIPFVMHIFLADGTMLEESILLNQRNQSFQIPISEKPKNVLIDGNDDNLAIINVQKDEADYLYQFAYPVSYRHRLEALQFILNNPVSNQESLLLAGLKDPHWSLRLGSLSGLEPRAELAGEFLSLAQKDSHSGVRAAAISLLSLADRSDSTIAVIRSIYRNDPVPTVQAASLQALGELDSITAITEALSLKDVASGQLLEAVAGILASTGNVEYVEFFESKIDQENDFAVMGLINHYIHLLQKVDVEKLSQGMERLRNYGLNSNSIYKRYASTKSLNDLKVYLGDEKGNSSYSMETKQQLTDLYTFALSAIQEIKVNEKNLQLKNAYMFF